MKNILGKQIPEGAIGIWWIGQGGFIFKTSENKVIVVDPYLSNSIEKKSGYKRMVEVPINTEEVVADLLLCTHDHLDHADPETIDKIKNVKVFIGPESVCRIYRSCGIPEKKVVRINRGEEKTFGDMKIFAIFARHTEDSVGYVLNLSGITIYISGDTEYDEELREVSKFNPDIMLVCINGKWGNMNVEEAALLTKDINPKLVMPMHYGMFKENTANPDDFTNYLEKLNSNVKNKILEFNDFFLYKKELSDEDYQG